MDSSPIQEKSPVPWAMPESLPGSPSPSAQGERGAAGGPGPGWRGPGALCSSGCWSQLPWFSEATLTPSTCSAWGSDYRLGARR